MDWYNPDIEPHYFSANARVAHPHKGLLPPLREMPANERAAMGFVPVQVGSKPDERYYFVEEVRNGPAISYRGTLRPIDQLKAIRVADVKAKSYAHETSGTVVGGSVVDTGDRSKLLVNGAYNDAVSSDPASSRWFDGVDGPVLVTNADIVAMAKAIALHVQLVFDARCTHINAINSLKTGEDVVAYDISTGWPEIPVRQ